MPRILRGACAFLFTVLLLVIGTVYASGARADTAATIDAHGSSSVTYADKSVTAIVVPLPSGAQPGDLILVSLAVAPAGTKQPVAITAPAGWTLVTRANHSTTQSLAVYSHRYVSGDRSAGFGTSVKVGGVAFASAWGGTDGTTPVDAAASTDVNKPGSRITAPSVPVVTSGARIVLTYAGFAANPTTWTPPSGASEIVEAMNSNKHTSGAIDTFGPVNAGATATQVSTTSVPQSVALAATLALRPAMVPTQPPPTNPPAYSGPPALIVDTDIYSDADDVGALALAYALQAKGEATILGVMVNTNSGSSVSGASVRCVQAINQFYGYPNLPVGSDGTPVGSGAATLDFINPCGSLSTAGPPAPQPAVTLYRQLLASAADGSVVIASIGFEENLAGLLASPADSISPLTGQQLIQQKVRSLVSMAGGYPSISRETNLAGNVAAAQAVASGWPTPIYWSGAEVGDAVHTGASIDATHPDYSPVRVAYDAFRAPGNWIYSYDLTAVYFAVRPSDPDLVPSAAGTNVVTSTGGDQFTVGAGQQHYLITPDASGLSASIDQLIDTVPPASMRTVPPIASTPTVSAITQSSASIGWTTDEPANGTVEFGTTTAYGGAAAAGTGTTTQNASLTGLQPQTTYHYRLDSTDAAGRTSYSVDRTFTTAGTGPIVVTGPADDFTESALDTSRWTSSSSGSTIAVQNGALTMTTPGGGAWTTGTVQWATPYDVTGLATQVQLNRAADNGTSNGTEYGETSIFLQADSANWAEFWVAGGSLTAWVSVAGQSQLLTSSWPAYNPSTMQILRFRESGGTLYWEYASIAQPTTWTTFASVPDPFPLSAVTLRMVAGANTTAPDTTSFGPVLTTN